METLRTSEIGKRLKEEWPDHYTAVHIELDCHPGALPELTRFRLYHEHVSWHCASTFEGCIAEVKEALSPKSERKLSGGTEVVIDTEVPNESDRSPTSSR